MREIYHDGQTLSNKFQKLSFYSPSSGYIAAFDQNWPNVSFTSDSGRTLDKRRITISNVNFNGNAVNLTFGFYINGVKAFDQNNLIAYGDYGLVPAILRSIDGGLNYTLVYHSQLDPLAPASSVMDMVFPQNDPTGYAVDRDRILKTTDQGLTWTVIKTDAGRKFTRLVAVDNNNIFAFGTDYLSGKLFRSINGGSSWQEITLPPSSTIQYVSFLTSSKGWLIAKDISSQAGTVYYTSDAGGTWKLKNDPEQTPFYCSKMAFINDSTGFALVGFDTYRTTDSGRIWEPLPRDNGFTYLGYYHNDLQLINNTQLWSGGDHELLEINTNTGGPALPKVFFKADTTGVSVTRQVNLVNYSKKGYNYEWFVNNRLISTSYHTTYQHDVYHPDDTIRLVVKNSAYTDSLEKYQHFGPVTKPTISSFTPGSGTAGSIITIRGTYLLKTSSVGFGSFPAASFNIISDSVVTAVVGDGGSGKIHITTIGGTDSLGEFTYIPPPPMISSISPAAATAGTVVTIKGNYFHNASAISFGGTPAITYSVQSKSQIKAVVGATISGNVNVVTPSGSGSINGFTFIPGVTLSDFSPLSAPVGTSVTITGKNFSPVTANNIVYFGGVTATVTSASSTELKVLVPAGADYKPISVIVNNQVAESAYSFLPTFPGGDTISSRTFHLEATFPVTNNPFGSGYLGDLDRDGKLDIVTGRTSVFRNTSIPGEISLAPRQDFINNDGASFFSLKDINGDGWLDLIKSSIGIQISKNISTTGNIAFANPIQIPTNNSEPREIAVADLDGDGRPDIVALLQPSGLIVSRNISTTDTLAFEEKISYPVGDEPWGCVLADLDQDYKPEIIITNYYSGNFSIYRNNSIQGKIDFDPPLSFPVTAGPTRHLTAADLDGDGKMDLAIVNLTSRASAISIARNISTGPGQISFDPLISFEAGGDAYSIKVADIDGDGKPDLQTANQSEQTVSLYRNKSTGSNISFGPKVDLTTGTNVYPRHAPLGDMDNDGKTDLVYINYNSNSLSIFRNGSGENFADAGMDTTICVAGPSVQIGSPALAGYSYRWSSLPAGFTSNLPGPTVSPTVSTKYLLTVTNPIGIKARDSVLVYIQNLIADAGNDQSLCQGTSTFIGGAPQQGFTYSWNAIPAGYTSAEARPFVSPAVTTQYCLLTTSAAGCSERDTVTITVVNTSNASVTINGDTAITKGKITLLTATPVNGGNSPWYVWQDSTSGHGWKDIVSTFDAQLNYLPEQTGDKVRCLLSTNKPCASPGTTSSNTLQFTVNVVTAITPVSADNYGIKFFPNPVSSILYLDGLKIYDKWESLEVFNIDGKQMIPLQHITNKRKIELNTAYLKAGEYLLILTGRQGRKVHIPFVKL